MTMEASEPNNEENRKELNTSDLERELIEEIGALESQKKYLEGLIKTENIKSNAFALQPYGKTIAESVGDVMDRLDRNAASRAFAISSLANLRVQQEAINQTKIARKSAEDLQTEADKQTKKIAITSNIIAGAVAFLALVSVGIEIYRVFKGNNDTPTEVIIEKPIEVIEKTSR